MTNAVSLKVGQFVLIQKLGEGSFAEAWLAEPLTQPDGQKVVIKRFFATTEEDAIAEEVSNAAAIQAIADKSDNLVRFFQTVVDEKNRSALVFEYCNAGNMSLFIKERLDQKTAKFLSKLEVLTIAKQLANGL